MGTLRRRSKLARALLLAGALGCGGATAEQSLSGGAVQEPPPPVPTFATLRVLTGPDGAKVEVAEFGDDQAYLKFTGVRSPAAGFVFPVTIRDNGRRIEYVTTWNGRDYHPINHETTPRGTTRWTLYAPELRDGVALEWSEDLSGSLDGASLHSEHVAQLRDGSLARVQTFDREGAESSNGEAIATDVAQTREVCGDAPEMVIRWDTMPDEVVMQYSMASYCGSILEGLRNLCRWTPAKELAARIERVECDWEGPEAGRDGHLSLDGTTLSWTVGADLTNAGQKARDALLALPTPSGDTLEQATVYARSSVCQSPDDAHYVVVHPHQQGYPMGISYGDAEALYHAPQQEDAGRGWFFDPRQFRESNNDNFRGLDLRFYSHVDVDDDADTCQLVCGDRETTWKLVDDARAREVMANAEARPTPFNREPYALAPRRPRHLLLRGPRQHPRVQGRLPRLPRPAGPDATAGDA